MSRALSLALAFWCGAAAVPAQSVPGDPRPRLPAGMGAALDSAVADLDGDGLVDLLRVEADGLRLLFQQRDGSFASAPSLVDFGGALVSDIATGDVDGDLDVDVVVALRGRADALLVNDGHGQLSEIRPSPFVGTGSGSTAQVAVADLNRDGAADVLLSSTAFPPRLLFADAVSGLFRDGSSRLPAVAAVARQAIGIGDVDGDGAPDLVLGGTSSVPPLWLGNDGTGDFRNTVRVLPRNATTETAAIRIAQLDAAGFAEVVMTGAAPSFGIDLVSSLGSALPRASAFTAPGPFVRDLQVVEASGDRLPELVWLASDGALSFARNLGGGRFVAVPSPVLPADSRIRFEAFDLEGDGDADLWVCGSRAVDRLLLGDGQSVPIDSEARSAPLFTSAQRGISVVLDVHGDGDPDLVRVLRDGSVQTFRNEGGSDLRAVTGSSPLPMPNAYLAVIVGRSSAVGGGRDVVCVASSGGAAGSSTLHALAPTGPAGDLVDVTATVLPAQPLGVLPTALHAAPLDGGSNAPSDLLIGTLSAELFWLRPAPNGVWQWVQGAFVAGAPGAVQQICSGDFDGNGLVDVLVVHSGGGVVLHTRAQSNASRWQPSVQNLTGLRGASDVVVTDLDLDGRDDVVLVDPGNGNPLSVLQSTPGGVLVDTTDTWLAPLLGVVDASGAQALALRPAPVGAFGATELIIGFAAREPLVVSIDPRNSQFSNPRSIPVRGAPGVVALLAADLDSDGDCDLVLERDNWTPRVLWGRERALLQSGVAQRGRELGLRFHAPPFSTAFVMYSPFTTRFAVPGLGLLRLVSPAALFSLPIGAGGLTEFSLPVPLTAPVGDLPLQAAFLEAGGQLRLSNLERAVIVGA